MVVVKTAPTESEPAMTLVNVQLDAILQMVSVNRSFCAWDMWGFYPGGNSGCLAAISK